MKKLLLCAMFGMMMSLTACGEVASSKNPIEETLTSTEWKAVINSWVTSMDFNEDGTGTIMYTVTGGKDMSWEIVDESIIKVEYEGNTQKHYYDLEYTKNDDSIRLTDQSEYMILVPSENYYAETSAVKKERSESAEVLDWDKAYDVYLDNAAKFNEAYAEHIWKWTAQVFEVGERSCRMANKTYMGLPSNSIEVYMDSSELMNISKGSTITVIGVLQKMAVGGKMYDAFVIE